jgi:hypothetical protein
MTTCKSNTMYSIYLVKPVDAGAVDQRRKLPAADAKCAAHR